MIELSAYQNPFAKKSFIRFSRPLVLFHEGNRIAVFPSPQLYEHSLLKNHDIKSLQMCHLDEDFLLPDPPLFSDLIATLISHQTDLTHEPWAMGDRTMAFDIATMTQHDPGAVAAAVTEQ